jgi:hypothetical protein
MCKVTRSFDYLDDTALNKNFGSTQRRHFPSACRLFTAHNMKTSFTAKLALPHNSLTHSRSVLLQIAVLIGSSQGAP